MKFLSLPKGARFSNKEIFAFLLPVVFELYMLAGLSIADTFMVAKLGETAVAGVALVSRIDNFAKQFFIALAQGGTVVLSQYIGAEDIGNSEKSLKDNLRIVVGLGLFIMLAMVFFKGGILNLLFGSADSNVLAISHEYFTVTAFSYPFVALYYVCTATFRAMGESKIPFYSSIVMMVINVVLKYIFIFLMDLGVYGAGLSTLIAMASVGLVLLIMLKNPHNRVPLTALLKPDFDRRMAGRILSVSVPNGLEQAMFQFGALLIAGLVSGLGEVAIAADHYSRTLSNIPYCMCNSFSTIVIVLVGQCMGAGDTDGATFYTKHILKLNYIAITLVSVLFAIFLKPLISIFGASQDATYYAYIIMLLYAAGSCTFYPLSFAVPAALRGAGDTKFVMLISVLSMFLFRILIAYVLVYAFDLGVVSIWVAMVSDWVLRSIVFVTRFMRGNWKEKHII